MKHQISEITEIEDLGESNDYVYDIGMVDNPHTFFANNILVHNSCFLSYENQIKENNIKNRDDIIKFCIEQDNTIKTFIESNLNLITSKMNSQNFYKFETEELYDKFLITSKKKYICRTVYDKNSKRLVENQYNIKGMEFKKSNLSKPIKELLKNIAIKIMAGMTEKEVTDEFKRIWDKLPEFPIDDIAFAQKVENLDKYGSQCNISFKNEKASIAEFPKGCPYHVTGSLALNALIDWDKDLHDMTKLVSGDKGKIVFVCPTNLMGVESITYVGKWNPKLYQYFKLDVEKLFMRLILQPLQPVLDAMKFNITLDGILGYRILDSNNLYVQSLLF